MPGKEMLLQLLDYHEWANEKLFDCAAKLPPEQLDAPTGYGYDTLRQTLFHILRADFGWWRAFNTADVPPPRLEDYPTVEDLRRLARQQGALARQTIEALDEDTLARPRQVKWSGGGESSLVTWQMLVQPLIHAVHHRAEAAQILTSFGQPPGDFDFIDYVQ
ncbi:MAG: hypothetical protein GX495_09220 [Chloroflexi bacterium]|jgi:uncharacterized damage-inducible protein DinB|nr:hypothetical protein [Chloroflexota bacterium]